jgi:ArsR family transcriptional regulator, arsenate/arsenite/antimonite-responsive transcriptional repressor
MKTTDAVTALAALAQPTRLDIFRLLVKRGPGGYTPSGLSDRLGVTAPTLSFHLKELLHAGLVESRRDGRFLHYSASFDRMNALVSFLTENCCALAAPGCAPACAPAAASPKMQKHRRLA